LRLRRLEDPQRGGSEGPTRSSVGNIVGLVTSNAEQEKALEDDRAQGWLKPGVRGTGAASLLADLGHEIPTALLPRLITSLGGSAAALGFIEGISDGLAGLARLSGGAVADDPERRRAAAVAPGP
jgi:hypothetical protein